MFVGKHRIEISKETGNFFPEFIGEDLCSFMSELMTKSGQICYVYAIGKTGDDPEILFAFEEIEDSECEEFEFLYSFCVSKDMENIKSQFYIPKELIQCFPKNEAYLVGICECFSICIADGWADQDVNVFELLDAIVEEAEK